MRRNMQLLQLLLKKVENSKDMLPAPDTLPVPGTNISFRAYEIQDHIDLCHRAGFLRDGQMKEGGYITLGYLTWAGHDLVESLSREKVRRFMVRRRRPAGFSPRSAP